MSLKDLKHPEQDLKRIKKLIENSYKNFNPNYKRFNEMRNFVFVSNQTTTDKNIDRTLNRPSLEFPILEPFISRLRGEFSKNEPSIMVSGLNREKADPQVIDIVEQHIRHILFEAQKCGFGYNVYTDTLTGGFCAAKVLVDYVSPKGFDQDIFVERTYDPTLTFFDQMARYDDKSDGRFCGECYPMYKEEFERQFPGSPTDSMSYGASTTGMDDFKWGYFAQGEPVIVVCDFYEKKIKRVKIMLCSDGEVRTVSEYNKYLKEFMDSGKIEQPAIVVGKPRMTELTTVCRYRLTETSLLDYEETIYNSLPIVFIDGDSILQKSASNSAVQQFCRPIVYSAKDTQRLKNFAGQALANELENMMQSKFMIAKGSVDAEDMGPWVEPQLMSALVYKAFDDTPMRNPLPTPIVVPRMPIEPIIMNTFQSCDMTVQNILGSFDTSLAKLGERDVSGIAIQETITLSNASAMPYVVSYLKGLQSIANIILQLIPKVYVTPRSIPVRTKEGKMGYVMIDPKGMSGIKFDYDPDTLQVKVEAGPSFSSQQAKAYSSIMGMSQANPMFSAFMGEKGMRILMDNVPDFRGSEKLKEEADVWMAELQQKQKAQAQQPNPEQVKMQIAQQSMQQKAMQDQAENQIAMQKLELERMKMKVDIAEMMASIEEAKINAMIAVERSTTEKQSKAADIAIESMKHVDKMGIENRKLQKELSKDLVE